MLVISGPPIAKGRPRFAGRHVYTPQKTKDYEKRIASEALAMGVCQMDEPVFLTIRAYFPLSIAAAKRGDSHHTKRPDLDNIIKIVCDALNGVAWRDDCQIVGVLAEKSYSDFPRLEIEWSAE
jgi:Holliday junction resolvase RusA-like endonuclease